MNIDDFLKPKKVRCINRDNRSNLTEGKIYDVIGATFGRLKIRNDYGDTVWYDMTCFELVIDSAENHLQNMESTPGLEAVEPKFKAGDKVYIPNIKNICTIRDDGKVITSNGQHYCDLSDSHDLCFVLATPENHALLSKLYPHIEFEQPAKELKGSDLARAMLERGDRRIYGYASDNSDNDPHGYECVVRDYDVNNGFGVIMSNGRYEFFNPCDLRTGELLTESVLDE